MLLQRKPLTACELLPSWNSSGWLADFIQIYPNKLKKQSFENQRENFLQTKLEKLKELEDEKNNYFKTNYSDSDDGQDPKD